MNTDRIEVLAVMDAVANQGEAGCFRPATDTAQLREARAAVAELIEAAGARVEWVNGSWYAVNADGAALSNVPRSEEGARLEVAETLRAALARVGGAK